MLIAALLLPVVILLTWSAARQQTEPLQPLSTQWTPALRTIVILAAVVGLALRLVGLDNSLWLDEFGTLWTIEGDLSTVIDRSTSFQGQSPLYYVIVWLFVNLLGESEVILRLPSLLATIATTGLLYRTGVLLHGILAGIFVGLIYWLNYWAIYFSSEGRPYSLAMFFAALALFGFVKATSDGRAISRAYFVIGAVGLIASHYVLAVMLLGIGTAYLCVRPLRERYRLSQFSWDVALTALLSAPLVPQFLAILGRRDELAWVEGTSYVPIATVMGAEALLFAAALTAGAFWHQRSNRQGTATLLGLSAALPPLVAVLLFQLGTNLLVPKYLIGALVPLCLLAGVALALVPPKVPYAGWLSWALVNGIFLTAVFMQTGAFTGRGAQGWRSATAELERRMALDPGAPLLFRSGFIEDNQRATGRNATSATLAPLRSPGRPVPAWEVTQLTATWEVTGRKEYFEGTVRPAIESHDVFYLLLGYRENGYHDRVAEWIDERFEGRYEAEWFYPGRGLVASRFSRAGVSAAAESHSDDTP